MSFLFCSWATNDEADDGVETEEEEDKIKETKNYFLEKSRDVLEKSSVNHKEEENTDKNTIANGINESVDEISKTDSKTSDQPFFMMWKTQEEVASEDDEECESEKSDEAEIKANGNANILLGDNKKHDVDTTIENGLDEEKEDSSNRTEHSNGVSDAPAEKPMFFAVWKDPNKEDEYISSSSEEEESEEENDVEIETDKNPLTVTNGTTENSNVENNGEDGDDLFDSIAKSVSRSMTTLICDDDEFQIKESFSDHDQDNTELTGEVVSDAGGSVSSGRRSRSGSLMSESGGVRRSLRDNKPTKKYDPTFTTSKPKPLSKYFEPCSFIDKSLYKTHRCDVRIKKFKIPGQDLEKLLPKRKKRKTADEDLPLSKRKKLLKTETKKPPKPRTNNSILKRESLDKHEATGDRYQGVCKYVSKQCPLCWNFWNCSQAFGLHVFNQTCQKTDKTSFSSDSDNRDRLRFLTVHAANNKTDSQISTSRIPSLKLLCRDSLIGKNSTSDVAISVKEGLEYYHSLMTPGFNVENTLFHILSRMGKITLVSSVRQYERLCRDPLKVAIFLERKISKSRANHGSKNIR